MAESYRGLTIRIGADTSKLSSALRAANGAITATANQARRLKQALVMDPGNMGIAAQQMSVAGTQADAVARKLSTLREAYRNVSQQVSQASENSGKTFGEIAKDTENADQKAQDLKQTYYALESQLANAYKQMSAISHNVGNGKNFKVTDGDTTDLEKIIREYDAIRRKREELNSLDSRTDEQEKTLKSLGRQIPKYAELIEKVRPLKKEFVEVSKAYDDAKVVAGLRDTEVEISKTHAQLVQLVRASENLSDSPIKLNMEQTNAEMKEFAALAKDAETMAELLGKQVNISPSGLVAAVRQGGALRQQFVATREQAARLGDAIKAYKSAGIDKVAANTKDAKKSAADARREYENAAARVKELKQGIEDAKAAQERLTREGKQNSDTYRQKAADIERFTQELREAAPQAETLREKLDISNAVVEYREATTQLEALKGTMSQMSAVGQLGNVTSAALLLAEQVGQYARQGVTEVVDSTVRLDSAFADMRKTVDGTEEEFQKLYDSAVAASKVQPISADTILSIEALGGQLGFANEGLGRLEEFAEVVSGLDVATNMDWETAGTYMAQFFNIFDTNKDLVSNYGSALVELGNHFATTETDIALMSSRIASAGTSIGMTEADVMGLSTALASMGVRAEAGGSSISTIMTNIDKSVAFGTEGIKKYADDFGMTVDEFVSMIRTLDDDALGDIAKNYGMTAKKFNEATVGAVDSLNEWAKVAGYDTAEKFAAAWEGDPIDALTAIFMGLDEAVEKEGNLAIMLDDLGVKSIRQLDISRRLASNPTLLADAVRSANTAWSENTALTNEVEKRNESLSARFETLENVITSVKTELGEGLSPIVDFAIDKMTSLADVLSDMPDDAKTGILAIGSGLAGLAVATPIINGVGGALGKFVLEVVKLGGMAASSISGIFTAFSMVESAADIIPAFSLAAGSVLGPLATALPVIGGVVAVLGGLALAYKNVIKPAMDAKKASADLNAALKVTRDTADNLAGGLKGGEDAVSSFGGVARKQAMSVRELADDLDSFNESISSMSDPVEKSNALLDEYQQVIDNVRKSGVNGAQDMAKLEWAVKGINDTFGTNYTAQDILNDKYVSEEGEIDNLCDHIDKLIAKRQEQARMDAAQDIYTESLKKQYEYEQNLDLAAENYKRAMEEAHEVYMNAHGGMDTTDEELLERNTMGVRRYKDELDAAQKALNAVNDEVLEAEGLLTRTTEAVNGGSDAIKNFVDTAYQGWDIDWSDALERNGIGLEEFAQKASDAGIGLEDLQAVANDPNVFFSQWVDECEGDIDSLIAKIQEYNDKEIEEKEVAIKVPDQKLSLDESKLDPGSSIQAERSISVKVDTASSMNEINVLTDAIDNVPKKVETTAFAYTDTADQNLITTRQLADALPFLKTIHVNFSVDTSSLTAAEQRYEQFKARTKNAAGGIRYHADGVILNRPTWIGNRDIAGEAGAEAIIPLTNKRYVQPFANTVADGMLSKLDGLNAGGDTYNITVNAAGDTGDDIARAITRELRAYQLMRTGR